MDSRSVVDWGDDDYYRGEGRKLAAQRDVAHSSHLCDHSHGSSSSSPILIYANARQSKHSPQDSFLAKEDSDSAPARFPPPKHASPHSQLLRNASATEEGHLSRHGRSATLKKDTHDSRPVNTAYPSERPRHSLSRDDGFPPQRTPQSSTRSATFDSASEGPQRVIPGDHKSSPQRTAPITNGSPVGRPHLSADPARRASASPPKESASHAHFDSSFGSIGRQQHDTDLANSASPPQRTPSRAQLDGSFRRVGLPSHTGSGAAHLQDAIYEGNKKAWNQSKTFFKVCFLYLTMPLMCKRLQS